MTETSELVAALVRQTLALNEDPPGQYRVEDILSAAAGFAGECCARAAGDYDVDGHNFAPGSAVYSDKVNGLLFGDKVEWAEMPFASAFGSLFVLLTDTNKKVIFARASFPDVTALLQRQAASAGKQTPATWGFVTLGIGSEHMPRQQPLRRAFELREWAKSNAPALLADRELGWTVARMALFRLLLDTHGALDEPSALAIAFETMNGIAKMAPFLPKHMEAVVEKTPPPRPASGLGRLFGRR